MLKNRTKPVCIHDKFVLCCKYWNLFKTVGYEVASKLRPILNNELRKFFYAK